MLYPTSNQPLMLLVIFVAGLFCGLLFDVFSAITNCLKNDKSVRHFFDFFTVIISFCLLFLLNLKLNFGQFRIYLLIVFIFALLLERAISKLLFGKILKKIFKKKLNKKKPSID